MCGILGQLSFDDYDNLDSSLFASALDLLRHRGPDDSDVFFGENYFFGHRRLSIIDLDSHAKQPMVSSCGRYVLIFNGEIYNYLELKEKLLARGHVFKTRSDTEVLLSCFIEFGVNCLQMLNGMFSFAVYDNLECQCYIVRDRLGIKPLFYTHSNNGIIFSSEIKSILCLDEKSPRLNYDAVSSYLSFRYPILDDTFFDDIYSLAPAHYIKVSAAGLDIVEYWSLVDKFDEQKNDRGEDYYINELKRLLNSSVDYMMISDVPTGAYLSGGVDSSIITALMANNSSESIKTFSVGFRGCGEGGCDNNEFQYSSIVADMFSTDHHEVVIDEVEYLDCIEELIEYKDAPLSVPNEVSLYLLSKELKEFITVVLSGEGADEIFGGYGRIFRSPHDLERIKNIDSLALSSSEKRKLVIQFVNKYSSVDFNHCVDHFINIYSYTSLKEKKYLLNESLDLDKIENKFISKFMMLFDELENESYYNKMMYAFEKVHLLGLLSRLDSSTMSNSVEGRVPFVDHRLVEFAFTIPIKYKLKWVNEGALNESKLMMSDEISERYDVPKYILKKSYEDLLPDAILYRRKVGFPIPLGGLMWNDLKKFASDVLLSKKSLNRKIVNFENINKLLDGVSIIPDAEAAMKIWMLLNLELFCRKYFDS